jgi:hypothetical protein
MTTETTIRNKRKAANTIICASCGKEAKRVPALVNEDFNFCNVKCSSEFRVITGEMSIIVDGRKMFTVPIKRKYDIRVYMERYPNCNYSLITD